MGREPVKILFMFSTIFQQHEWTAVRKSIYDKTPADVERALARSHRDLEDFKSLISPAAAPYLETMAQISHQLTLKRFGKVIQMYIPLYLSNECQNICTYCGFSYDNKIRRKTLNAGELLREVAAIRDMGYEHVLLVSGEANQTVGVDYFIKALQNYWRQGGNAFGTTGVFGTLDSNHVDFYTNNKRRGRWMANGNRILDTTVDNGAALQVNGKIYSNQQLQVGNFIPGSPVSSPGATIITQGEIRATNGYN